MKRTGTLIVSQYHPGTRWRLRVLLSTLPISAEDIVLDAGCGDGYISSQLAMVAKEVVGVDIDQGIIERNRKTFDLPNLRFVACDLNELGNCFAINTFSKIVCTDVLEHSYGFKRILENFSHVLRTDGFLYFTVPLGNHGHFVYDAGGVADILVEKGFLIVHLAKIAPPPITSNLMHIFHWASNRLYGRPTGSDVWSDTKAFELAQKDPNVLRLYRLFVFPILNGLTYLDRKPYKRGNTLLVLGRKGGRIEGAIL